MSETYRALTRKYRPHSFEDIVSQEHVSSTIQNAIKQNRLSHAYMFCGPRGVGKTTMARVIARTINEIDSSVDGESLTSTLNIVELDAASNRGVDDVARLQESVRIPPQNGRYKVFIIDEVHMLSSTAFNALLKTLEEPPAHVIFIFATTEPHKVLPTILSRVQRFDFKRIAVKEIVERLRKISLDENISIDEESLHVIAKKADGALRDALSLMDQAIAFCGETITYNELLQALNVVGIDRLFQLMECVKEHDADKGLELINTLLQEGYDIQEYLVGLTEHLRNLYVAHESAQLYLVEASEDTKARYQQSAPDFTRDDLMRMLHMISEAQIKLKNASQPRIQFEITLLKLIHMERAERLSELLQSLEELKKNSGNFVNTAKNDSNTAENTSETESSSAPKDHDAKDAKEKPTSNEAEVKAEKDADNTQEVEQNSESSSETASVKQEEAVHNNSASQRDNGDSLPAESQPETALAEGTDEKLDDHEMQEGDDYDLGAPALMTNLSKKTMAAKKTPMSNGNRPSASTSPHHNKNEASRKVTLELVQEQWPVYLEALKGDFPMLLHLQMERVKVVKLKGSELYLECENLFSKKMVDEQNSELQKKLKECVGSLLRFNVSVGKQDERQKPMSVYERFKQIQQKDPIIRDIVEIFGAELEY